MFRRANGAFYSHDSVTGKQHSLNTPDKIIAKRLLHAKNEAYQQPVINLHIARAYLSVADAQVSKRTWRIPMEEIVKLKHGETRARWISANKDKAFNSIRDLPILQTRAEHFLKVLECGTVSTNVYLRRLHNFALDMNWLAWPIIPKRQWPKITFKEKRAITLEEHQAIVNLETNPERKAYFELAWHLGASQTDIARLEAENIDWQARVIAYHRKKTKEVAILRFSDELERIFRSLPKTGPLFPRLRTLRAGDRSMEFKVRCKNLGITGVSLHCYRYAWAERAKQCGYPERYAQLALGHNSQAVHRAYARKAQVQLPPLEEYEKMNSGNKVIPFQTMSSPPAEQPVDEQVKNQSS